MLTAFVWFMMWKTVCCENADWFSGSVRHDELYKQLSDCRFLS